MGFENQQEKSSIKQKTQEKIPRWCTEYVDVISREGKEPKGEIIKSNSHDIESAYNLIKKHFSIVIKSSGAEAIILNNKEYVIKKGLIAKGNEYTWLVASLAAILEKKNMGYTHIFEYWRPGLNPVPFNELLKELGIENVFIEVERIEKKNLSMEEILKNKESIVHFIEKLQQIHKKTRENLIKTFKEEKYGDIEFDTFFHVWGDQFYVPGSERKSDPDLVISLEEKIKEFQTNYPDSWEIKLQKFLEEKQKGIEEEYDKNKKNFLGNLKKLEGGAKTKLFAEENFRNPFTAQPGMYGTEKGVWTVNAPKRGLELTYSKPDYRITKEGKKEIHDTNMFAVIYVGPKTFRYQQSGVEFIPNELIGTLYKPIGKIPLTKQFIELFDKMRNTIPHNHSENLLEHAATSVIYYGNNDLNLGVFLHDVGKISSEQNYSTEGHEEIEPILKSWLSLLIDEKNMNFITTHMNNKDFRTVDWLSNRINFEKVVKEEEKITA
ncbi:MAG: hypothetical protein HYV53_05195 [Parcubacteria group bacterium]|nr:hypothetical protein [Parcubacteria group bacterium]